MTTSSLDFWRALRHELNLTSHDAGVESARADLIFHPRLLRVRR